MRAVVLHRSFNEDAWAPRDVAIAYCHGTPLIEARDPLRLEEATGKLAAAFAQRFGDGPTAGCPLNLSQGKERHSHL
jgi:hypothetical protein